MNLSSSSKRCRIAELFGVSDADFLETDPFAHWFTQENKLTSKYAV
jgi:hypothetical protein